MTGSVATKMPTFKMTVAYDGTAYCGWQVQVNGDTIQGQLETALAKITCQRVRVTGSGRTDAGVHALAQVASFSVATQVPAAQLMRALNGNLPGDIRVLELETVAAGFHAIRDATGKRYRYVIDDGPQADVFRRRFAWHVHRRLQTPKMVEAASHLLGTHDFSSFQAAGSPRASTEREMRELHITRLAENDNVIHIEMEANGFLYNMARNIVGSLVEVGLEKQPPAWLAAVLAAGDRRLAARTAPPHGLFLVAVRY